MNPPLPSHPDRRLFLQATAGGLVVTSFSPTRRAGASAREGRAALEGEPSAKLPEDQVVAWLVLGPGQSATLYAGKVELGQGVRTNLCLAVAEELRLDSVDHVMTVLGNTGEVPFDVGTFGSLSTPVVFAKLRQVAATVREYLIDQAAGRWSVDRKTIQFARGALAHPPSGRSLSWLDLAEEGRILQPINVDANLTPPVAWKVAGRSTPPPTARLCVTGRLQYISTSQTANARHGKILRPPAIGLRLKSFDRKAADTLDGVILVHEGDFLGVVAPSLALAEEAIEQLGATVEWEGEPPPDRSREFTDLLVARQRPAPRGDQTYIERGDLQSALTSAHCRLSARYTAAAIAHVPLEPRACEAQWLGDSLKLRVGTQVPFGVRGGVARHFGLPDDKVVLECLDVGGGFGVKHTPEIEIETARLARAVPNEVVRVAWTRAEEFTQGYSRPPAVVDVEAGTNSEGHLTAWSFHSINPGTAGLDTPYRVPNRLCAFHPSDLPLRQGSYRALASTVHHFARESMMDELARALNLDPAEFRLRNLENPRIIEALHAATDRFGWSMPLEPPSNDKQRGRGLACGFEKGAAFTTCVEVEIDRSTREVRVTRLLTAFGPGAIVNPDGLANQIEGASIQSLGGALFEAVDFNNGRIRNASLSRYRVPRFRDMPKVDVILIDHPEITPAGAGEIPLVGPAPAIANAIHDATGDTRLRGLPLVPRGLPASS